MTPAASVLRDARTLMKTSAEEIAARLNAKPPKSLRERLVGAATRLYVAYLKWEAERVEETLEALPATERADLEAEERRSATRRMKIKHRSAEIEFIGRQRLELLREQIKQLDPKSSKE